MREFSRLVMLGLLICLPYVQANANDHAGPYRSSFLGTAAEGYDVVAYFTLGKAVEGKSEFSHEWQDVTWHFSSAEHRDQFAADPLAYAPKYGGYCAYAVSQGYTAGIDPLAWTIVDGKLYLNYSKSVQSTWAKDISGYIASAEQKWPQIRSGL
ncbi:YHS domain-containing (seleno)protein [Sneathiella glossodoripedis]|uniref:YHS domain-containing (seleno)protein n=1 Tax=Sneathiella glossodoripedis TaxID=418853 RepID=UPI00046EE25B|nr:YHS domain-containing (seleno)protein [Sneathiella glossodoripedis]